MRKQNQEITDPTIIKQILSDNFLCRVAMNDVEAPYLLPFNYGYQKNCLYIHSALEGKKIDLLRTNPKVCFEIEDKAQVIIHENPCNWSTLYRSVIGYGNTEIITSAEQKKQALQVIMNQHGATKTMEFPAQQVERITILKITITSLTGKQSGNWNSLMESASVRISTDRLFMNEVTWDDVEHFHHLHSYPEVDEFNTVGLPAGIEETKRYLRPMIEDQNTHPRKSYTWIIRSKEEDVFIGIAGLIPSNDKFRLGEIFYKLLPEHWDRGYATEIAKALIKAGFEKFNLHKVEAGVATGNIRSIKVLEKAGMVREGLRRKILPIRGKWVDNYHYAIVEDEWKG